MNNPTITIRDADESDARHIVRFNIAMAKETEAIELDAARAKLGVDQALADPSRARYFLAVVGGEVVGQTMVTLEWSDWRSGFFWWIQSVYVEPSSRRRGIFRALYQHVQQLAKADDNVCGIRLYVVAGNDRALQTYKNLGMEVTDYVLCEEDWSNDSVESV